MFFKYFQNGNNSQLRLRVRCNSKYPFCQDESGIALHFDCEKYFHNLGLRVTCCVHVDHGTEHMLGGLLDQC